MVMEGEEKFRVRVSCVRWRKMMTWQCFIGVDVFARINVTWLVLVGQF